MTHFVEKTGELLHVPQVALPIWIDDWRERVEKERCESIGGKLEIRRQG